MRYDLKHFMLIFCCAVLVACTAKNKSKTFDTPSSGKINISVDESFKPVIEEQIKVYESSFPNTEIIAHYKPEAECFKDFFFDTSCRMMIVTKTLNGDEEQIMLDSLNYIPFTKIIATDAVTVVVNRKSTDTLFTVARLRDQMSGKLGNKQQIVFDGLKATSTIRYAMDSILGGKPFDTTVVRAVKSSQDVLNFVAENENAIGFVGLSWIGNPEDTGQVNMLKKVKMAYVRCDKCADSPYVKPTQFGILADRYPLVRGLYYILKENFNGLGSGFANFLQFERGQLIFRRAYLGPKMGFLIRDVSIKKI